MPVSYTHLDVYKRQAGAFPVVEDELAVVLDGPSKGSERIELPAIGNFPNPGVERRLSLLA